MKGLFCASGLVALLLSAAACQRAQDEKATADETVSITKWTEKTELFDCPTSNYSRRLF